jgi:hypothetical protein
MLHEYTICMTMPKRKSKRKQKLENSDFLEWLLSIDLLEAWEQ